MSVEEEMSLADDRGAAVPPPPSVAADQAAVPPEPEPLSEPEAESGVRMVHHSG